MQANPVSIIVLLLGSTLAVIAVYSWRHRSTRGSQMFALFMGSITVYVLGYGMELASTNLSTMLFWTKIEYIGTLSFPNLFLLFVLQYTNREKWLTWKTILLLNAIPSILFIIKMFDETWHLLYSSAWVDNSGLIPLLAFTRGPVYPMSLYSIIPVSLGLVFLIQKIRNPHSVYRKQASIIIVSVVPALLVYILYLSDIVPFQNLKHLDLNAFMYPLWALGIGWAIFRYHLLDLAPIAREALIEHLNDGVCVLDDQDRLVDANPAAMKIMGWKKSPIGQDITSVFASWNGLLDLCRMAGSVDAIKVEIQHEIDDENMFFDISSTPLKGEKGNSLGQLIVIHDITDLKRLEGKLLELTLIDDLTGLNNRRGFYLLAEQLIQMIKRMKLNAAIIYFDLDDLKLINDTYGHAEGDRALVNTANLLRNTFRSSDIIARLGGDEFVVMGIEVDGAEKMLSRLKSQMEKFNSRKGLKYQIQISFGTVHFYPENTCTLDDLLEQADKNMYKHKQAKKRADLSI